MSKRLLAVAFALCCAACASTHPAQPRLYDELGGQPGIEGLVEDLLVRISEDPRIAHHFADVDIVNLHAKLVEQICFESDGPCTYTGKDMVEAHAHLDINAMHFNAMVEDLVDVMEARGIPRRAQNRLLAKLAPMQRDTLRGGGAAPPPPRPEGSL